MPSTSKSNKRKPRTAKTVPKQKKQRHAKKETRNWLNLPSDVMGNILGRVGVCDILENAQKVCTTWRNICKDPAMWRVIHMDEFNCFPGACKRLQKMCKNAVDRSKGQLVDITIAGFVSDELIQYVGDRANQLRRLEIACYYGQRYGTWTEILKKFPLLEELSLYHKEISEEAIETVARYCPLLKVLKVNQDVCRIGFDTNQDKLSIAIGKNLCELKHLELIGDCMANIGLQAILDGCCHLESLDLRKCGYIDFKGDLQKRCLQQIKYLKKPDDSLEDCPYISDNASDSEMSDSDPFGPPWMCDPSFSDSDHDLTALYTEYYTL